MLTQTPISVGAAANDKTGDKLRTGGQKINSDIAKLFILAKTIQSGVMLIFKHPGNNIDANQGILEVGDAVKGWFSSVLFIEFATYTGGSPGDINSYNISTAHEFDQAPTL